MRFTGRLNFTEGAWEGSSPAQPGPAQSSSTAANMVALYDGIALLRIGRWPIGVKQPDADH
jgi:hypothetical protein